MVFFILPIASGGLFLTFSELKKPKEFLKTALLCLSLGFSCLYACLRHEAFSAPFSGLESGKVCAFTARLSSDSCETASGRVMYRGRLSKVLDKNGTTADASGNVTVLAGEGEGRYLGETITVSGSLLPAEGNSGYLCFADGDDVAGTGKDSNPILAFRAGILSTLKKRIRRMDENAGSLFLALFIGDRDLLPQTAVDGFRKSGTTHILALSGMHLAVLSGILALILKPLAGRKGAFIVSAFILAAYIVLAGPKPSLLRAGGMYFLGGVFFLRKEKIQGLHLLFLTFFLMAAAAPDMLTELSFQLSFLALFGIFTAGGFFESLLARFVPRILRIPLSASLGAQAAVTPLAAFRFGAVYPVGIAASVILSPLVTLFMWTGMALLCLPDRGFFLFAILNKIARCLYDAMIMITGTAGRAPALTIESVQTKAAACLFCFILFCAMFVNDGFRARRLLKRT